MKDLLMAFWVESEEYYKKSIDIACDYHVKNEDWSYCVMRERGSEMLQARLNGIPHIVYTGNGKIIYTGICTELNDSSIIFHRKPINAHFLDGYKRYATEEDDRKIFMWPKNENAMSFVKRSLSIIDFEGLKQFVSNKDNFKKEIFVKTIEKRMSGGSMVVENMDWSEEDRCFTVVYPEYIFGYAPQFNSGAIVSEVVSFSEEYRCFCFDGEAKSVGLYNEDFNNVKAPRDVVDFANEVAKACSNDFDKGFVVDVGINEYGLDVVEFNPVESSGRFHNNRFMDTFVGIFK